MMIFILGILCASGIFITFKFWDKYDVDPFYATVINYFVSMCVAYFLCSERPSFDVIVAAEWFPYAVGLGSISLFDFNLNSFVTKKLGIGVTSISSKLSLLIPVTLAIVLFNESVSAAKIVGVLMALCALVMISVRGESVNTLSGKKLYLFLPLFVFFGSGANDFMMLSLGRVNVGDGAADITNIVFVVFTMAFLLGLLSFIVARCFGKMHSRKFIAKRNILGGAVMGIVSICCFSLYLSGVGQLTAQGWDGSVLASIYAISVLAVSVMTGIILFKERFLKINYIGIVVALVAIAVLSLVS